MGRQTASIRHKIAVVMGTAFDNEEPLSPEEILLRFKKIMGRDMTPDEKHKFFLPAEIRTEPDSEKT